MNTEQTALQMIAGAARCPEYAPATSTRCSKSWLIP